jgi:hypothetical protein
MHPSLVNLYVACLHIQDLERQVFESKSPEKKSADLQDSFMRGFEMFGECEEKALEQYPSEEVIQSQLDLLHDFIGKA